MHRKAVLKRGKWVSDDIRFCFTVYEDNEQAEPGDTLIHTFHKPNWAYCKTKWCYFFGKIVNVFSPSTSALFHYHNQAPCIGRNDIPGNVGSGEGWTFICDDYKAKGKGYITDLELKIQYTSGVKLVSVGIFVYEYQKIYHCISAYSAIFPHTGVFHLPVNMFMPSGSVLGYYCNGATVIQDYTGTSLINRSKSPLDFCWQGSVFQTEDFLVTGHLWPWIRGVSW